eukprot:6284312-Pyramimonas_sp.AAC.1
MRTAHLGNGGRQSPAMREALRNPDSPRKREGFPIILCFATFEFQVPQNRIMGNPPEVASTKFAFRCAVEFPLFRNSGKLEITAKKARVFVVIPGVP